MLANILWVIVTAHTQSRQALDVCTVLYAHTPLYKLLCVLLWVMVLKLVAANLWHRRGEWARAIVGDCESFEHPF